MPSFQYERLRGRKEHYYQAVATYRPAIVIPAPYLKDPSLRGDYEALKQRIYRDLAPTAGTFLSRFAKKSGVTHWHLILEERVIKNLPAGGEHESLSTLAEDYRDTSVTVSSRTFERSHTSFKPFFNEAFDQAVNATGILGDSALYLFIYTVSIRAYLR